jgi:pilus assembly protein Flp/PilA
MEDSGMARIASVVSRLHRTEGQGLAEYALILALIAIVVIVALQLLGGSINSVMQTVGNSI